MAWYAIILQNPLRVTDAFSSIDALRSAHCVRGVREIQELDSWQDTGEHIEKSVCGKEDVAVGTIGVWEQGNG